MLDAAKLFLSGLITELPTNGKWTAKRRDAWTNAARAIVDLIGALYETVEEKSDSIDIGRSAWLEETAQ